MPPASRVALFAALALGLACAGLAPPPDAGLPQDAARPVFSLLAVGDTGEPTGGFGWRRRQLAVGLGLEAEDRRLPADALLLLGDNFYPDGLEASAIVERVRENIVRPYCRFVSLEAPLAQVVREACVRPAEDRNPVPIRALLGNHDYGSAQSPDLQRHAVPLLVDNWRLAESPAELIEFPAGVSLVLVDSMAVRRGADLAPLRDALRRSRGPWRIVAAHHPLAEAAVRPGRLDREASARMRAALREAGVPVHLFLAGHDHVLAVVDAKDEMPRLNVTAGTGYRPRASDASTENERFARSELGFVRIDLLRGPTPRLAVSVFTTPSRPLISASGARRVGRWEVDAGGVPRRVTTPAAAVEAPAPRAPLPPPPPPDDQSAPALQDYLRGWLAAHGGDVRGVALEAKAELFEWMLWRYHQASWGQVMPRVRLPEASGAPVEFQYGADVSTWNGALLAALSYEYAVTKRPETLVRIASLLEGMHLFLAVTGQPGLAARCVLRSDTPVGRADREWIAPDGSRFFYRGDPAKGTYNQLALGYATLLMLAGDALPAEARRRALDDLHALVLHLLEHDYRLTERDGTRTPYGNLTPRWGPFRIPFNAQVAYMIVATGETFPPDDPDARRRISTGFRELRDAHVYWAPRWSPTPLRPQRVGQSRFIGLNDQNHLANAAFAGLALELYAARRDERTPDRQLLHRLGRTLYWSVRGLEGRRHSLVSFMWAGILSEPPVLDAVAPAERAQIARQVDRLVGAGVEQLRRFSPDRFRLEGREVIGDEVQWVDDYRPDSYHWKVDPRRRWVVEGPATNLLTSAIDYLHAYWLLRYYGLEEHPAATGPCECAA